MGDEILHSANQLGTQNIMETLAGAPIFSNKPLLLITYTEIEGPSIDALCTYLFVILSEMISFLSFLSKPPAIKPRIEIHFAVTISHLPKNFRTRYDNSLQMTTSADKKLRNE